MAIQVGGTSVISNNRVLENVTGLKTVNGTAILGSGDIVAGGGLGGNFNMGNGSGAKNLGFRSQDGVKGVPNAGTWLCFAGINSNSTRQMTIEVDGNTSKANIEGAFMILNPTSYIKGAYYDDANALWVNTINTHNTLYSTSQGYVGTHVAWIMRTNGAVNFKNNRNDNGSQFGYEEIL